MNTQCRLMVAVLLAIVSMTAAGHAEPAAHTHGLWAGVIHPVTGPDHLAALILLGVWMHRSAAGGLSIVALMGGLFAGVLLWGIGLPAVVVEGLVLASLPLAAAAMVWGRSNPAIITLLSAFMLFHGLAHAPAGAVAVSPGFAVGLTTGSVAVLLSARLIARIIRVPPRDGVRLMLDN